MARTSFFIDTTKCTGCRGCQVACKQWNQNQATKTVQQGTYQNPPDLSVATFKLVRFSDGPDSSGEPTWYFFPDQCRHCIYPPCKIAADKRVKDAVIFDARTRAVIFNPAVKISPEDFKDIREHCPFDIPRYDEKQRVMARAMGSAETWIPCACSAAVKAATCRGWWPSGSMMAIRGGEKGTGHRWARGWCFQQ